MDRKTKEIKTSKTEKYLDIKIDGEKDRWIER
jgi:hypothetical protein